MTPVILEVAINGATSPDKNPRVPTGHAAIAREAVRTFELGAAIVHAHNTDISLTGQRAADDYVRSWASVYEQVEHPLWYPTLTLAKTIEERLEHIERLAELCGVMFGTWNDPMGEARASPPLSSGRSAGSLPGAA